MVIASPPPERPLRRARRARRPWPRERPQPEAIAVRLRRQLVRFVRQRAPAVVAADAHLREVEIDVRSRAASSARTCASRSTCPRACSAARRRSAAACRRRAARRPSAFVTAIHRASALLPFSCGFEYSVHWPSTVPAVPADARLVAVAVGLLRAGTEPRHLLEPAGITICMPKRGSIGRSALPGVNAASRR